MQIFAYLYPYLFRIVHIFWTAQGCVDMVSFHDQLRSAPEFRHHLPVILRIHNLLVRTCIWRAAGRCRQNSVSDRSRTWKLTILPHRLHAFFHRVPCKTHGEAVRRVPIIWHTANSDHAVFVAAIGSLPSAMLGDVFAMC